MNSFAWTAASTTHEAAAAATTTVADAMCTAPDADEAALAGVVKAGGIDHGLVHSH